MRRLTVIRRKAFFGRKSIIKLYIEDPNGDTEISGIKCRFLGELKNNSKLTFEIGTETLKLFAIYNKKYISVCNDCYIVPNGEEEYIVSGIMKIKTIMGNPFYFDGVTDETILAFRRKKKIIFSIGLVIAICSLIVGIILGCVIFFSLIKLL